MLRISSLLSLILAALVGLSAYWPGPAKSPAPLRAFPINSTVAQFFYDDLRALPEVETEYLEIGASDSASTAHVLLFQYCSYDSAYANKMHRFVQREVPGAVLTDFWEGTEQQLRQTLADQQVVVVAYPSGGAPRQLRAYGKVLDAFVRKGGTVVIAGTHDYGVLQQLGLFDVEDATYVADPTVHLSKPDHQLLASVVADFSSVNYAYPLSVTDSDFVAVAEIDNNPVVGYKPIGEGRVVYLGLEYYTDEVNPTRLLSNTLRWAVPAAFASTSSPYTPRRTVVLRRSEERLVAGSGSNKTNRFNLKVYPNPYVEKATLEVEMTKAAPVSIEMSDETGVLVANLLPQRSLTPGYYRFELPNVEPGIYFVQCKSADQTVVRRVVKMAER